MKFQMRHESKPEGVFFAKQVHKTHAIQVTSSDSMDAIAQEEADALWTTEPGVSVGIKTADCGIVLLKHKKNLCAIAIHAGWRGAVAGIIPKTLEHVMCETGLRSENFEAKIGPCVSFDVYEVGPEVAQQVPKQFLKPGQRDRFYFDLRSFLKQQLLDSGVQDIQVSEHCTFSEPDKYFSHRRGDAGRQYSYVTLGKHR